MLSLLENAAQKGKLSQSMHLQRRSSAPKPQKIPAVQKVA
jgi:hypothetical protein